MQLDKNRQEAYFSPKKSAHDIKNVQTYSISVDVTVLNTVLCDIFEV